MGACKHPVLGLGADPDPIDKGTLCRNPSRPPISFGLEPLAVDAELIPGGPLTVLQYTVREALRRGASHLGEVIAKYMTWSASLSTFSELQAFAITPSQNLEQAQWIAEREREEFSRIIDSEFEQIQHLVGPRKEGKQNREGPDYPIESRADYQYRVRPLYYSKGYTDPVSFLSKIRKYNFLGERPTWIHENLAARLDKLGPVLESYGVRPKSLLPNVRSVLGIQIRYIHGTETLSYHAFGLAIDIDAYSNPHVKGQAVIDALNWVVGYSFDFGAPILTVKERGHQEWTVDDVMEVHNRAIGASRTVQSWLAMHLPRYQKLYPTVIVDIEKAEESLKIKAKPSTKLQDRVAAVRHAADLTHPGRIYETFPLDTPEEAIATHVTETSKLILEDEDLRRIQILYENTPETKYSPGQCPRSKYIETWAEKGILTIPMYLAAALVAGLHLDWGELWKQHKDAMHFELEKIAPDDPLAEKEMARTLARLLESAFYPGAWLKLSEPVILRRRKKKK